MITEASKRERLSKADRDAERIIRQYDFPDAHLEFVSASENVVYTVLIPASGGALQPSYVLRLHRPRSFHHPLMPALSRNAIHSEMQWLLKLTGIPEICAPAPVRNKRKDFVTTVSNGEDQHATVLHWLDGVKLNRALEACELKILGRLMARLHKYSLQFKPGRSFSRPVWDEIAMSESVRSIYPMIKMGLLSVDEFHLFEISLQQAREVMARLRHLNQYGLIHTDMTRNNFFFHEGQPRMIDFGRCGFGYFHYDIARALSDITDRDHASRFYEGYLEFRDLPGEYRRDVDIFMNLTVAQILHLAVFRESEELPDLVREYLPRVRSVLGGGSFFP